MILHITNDYSGSAVYKNMVIELDNLHISQIVYTPIRNKSKVGKNSVDFKQQESKIMYSPILSRYLDRIFYQKKIKKIVKDIEDKIDLTKISLIHAHTWYSDGGVAYILSQKYKIPYVVAIRNTDINLFFKYLIHERSFGIQILQKAKKVVTISEVYKKRVLALEPLSEYKALLLEKLLVITNGVDPYWIDNTCLKPKIIEASPIPLLYIGKFDKGKNVLNLVRAVKEINSQGKYNLLLSLIGGGGRDQNNILKEIKNDNNIYFLGKIYDKNKLLEIYRSHSLFLMPSKAETFGLVYIEALLQGLPVLYTANEGIDGFYDENIGEKVDSTNAEEIELKLVKLIENYSNYNIPIHKLIENHNWKNIALQYQKLFTK